MKATATCDFLLMIDVDPAHCSQPNGINCRQTAAL